MEEMGHSDRCLPYREDRQSYIVYIIEKWSLQAADYDRLSVRATRD